MTISVLGFASFPSSLTQTFPKIILFFQDSNCVYVTLTNPSPKRLESILHLPFHLINRPSKLIISHSELTKVRNENSLSHWVAETADSYTAPLPLLSLLSWSYVHPWLEDPIWRSYVLLRQVLYTLGSSVRHSSLRQHFRSSPQNQMPQDPKTYSWPCPFSLPGPWWVDPLGSPHMISWTQRPFFSGNFPPVRAI